MGWKRERGCGASKGSKQFLENHGSSTQQRRNRDENGASHGPPTSSLGAIFLYLAGQSNRLGTFRRKHSPRNRLSRFRSRDELAAMICGP